MFKAQLLGVLDSNGIKCILPIYNSNRVIVLNQDNDFLVYTMEDKLNVRLLYTYSDIFDLSSEIEDLAYSDHLKTVFVKFRKSFVLLDGNNLKQYNKVVDKRGIDKFWLFEHVVSQNNSHMTILTYSVKGVLKLRMLMWVDEKFQSIQEISLYSKHENVESVTVGTTGCYVVSSDAVYLWPFMQSVATRIEKMQKPAWPQSLYDSINELGTYQLDVAMRNPINEITSIRSSDSILTLSDKLSISSLLFRKPHDHAFQNIRLAFQPSDRQYPVILDGKSRMLLQCEIAENGMHFINAVANKKFYDRNKEFDTIQYLTSRLLLINNSNNIRIVHYRGGFIYMDVFINRGIKQVFIYSAAVILVWTKDNALEFHRFFIGNLNDTSTIYDESEESQYEFLKGTIGFYESIIGVGFIEDFYNTPNNMNIDEVISMFYLKLRDFTLSFAIESYEKLESMDVVSRKRPEKRAMKLYELSVKQVFDIFIQFLAPPELVIRRCLPPEMSEILDKIFVTHTRILDNSRFKLSAKLINRWCLPYFTELRRNLHNLQKNSESGTITWEYNSYKLNVGLSFFQIQLHETLKVEDLLKIVDTVLFQIYLRYNCNLVGPLIRVDNSCDFNIVEESLKKTKMFQELIDYYYNINEHDKALKLLMRLPEYIEDNNNSNGLEAKIQDLIIDYLRKLPNQFLDTIFEYTDWLLGYSNDTEFAINNIFMSNSPSCKSYDREKVYTFINNHNEILSLKYLEYIINVYHHKDAKLFNCLIMRYIQLLDEAIFVKKLKAILKTTYYEPRIILRHLSIALEKEGLSAEKVNLLKLLSTYPLKRLDEHETALGILTDVLDDYALSSQYCNEVFLSNKTKGIDVLMLLFDKLISKVELNGWKSIHFFLLENGSKLDTLTLLERLPSNTPISSLSEFLGRKIKNISMIKNQSRMWSNLLRADLIEQNHSFSQLISEFVIIDEDDKCYICYKNLNIGSSEWLSLYKHNSRNIVTHYNCARSLQLGIPNDQKDGNNT